MGAPPLLVIGMRLAQLTALKGRIAMTQTPKKTLPPKDEKWGDWIQILINGGRADQAAAKAMREEILQVCRTIEVLPTRQNVASELVMSNVAFTRRLKKLGIESEFKAILQSRRNMSHTVSNETP
jgi:hypothetical protein